MAVRAPEVATLPEATWVSLQDVLAAAEEAVEAGTGLLEAMGFTSGDSTSSTELLLARVQEARTQVLLRRNDRCLAQRCTPLQGSML